MTCPRCQLRITGRPHATPDDCLAHLAPRYQMAQRSLTALHRRYRTLEDRLERARIQTRVAQQEARKARTITGRIERMERMVGVA